MATDGEISTKDDRAKGEAPTPKRSAGRGLYILGFFLLLCGPIAYGIEAISFEHLTVPWYMPVLGVIGLLLMIVATVRRWSVLRIFGLLLFGLLPFGEFLFLWSHSLLPKYDGPIAVGKPLPDFEIELASGDPFDNTDLLDGSATVMVFFRGRW